MALYLTLPMDMRLSASSGSDASAPFRQYPDEHAPWSFHFEPYVMGIPVNAKLKTSMKSRLGQS